jgi:superfamily I DNA/RNA helicase
MDFRIADTFTASLARLNGQEQKAAKITAIDLQMDPSSPGLHFHRIDKSRDPNFWSLRVGSDLRMIVHKTAGSILLCYVDHHDSAYAWAERRRIEEHPRTRTIQIVETRELVDEAVHFAEPAPPLARMVAASSAPQSLPFSGLSDTQLLDLGVPSDWLATIRPASEDKFLEIADHLPPEAAEALLEFAATGILPAKMPPAETIPLVEAPPPVAAAAAQSVLNFSASPDTARRFRVVENAAELEEALAFPWEKWSVFLHPSQRALVEQHFIGPARVAGSAGTGKTVVALHRAVRLLRKDPRARVLLTTFSEPLARALQAKIAILLGNDPAAQSRLAVLSFRAAAEQLYELAFGRRPAIAPDDLVRSLLSKAAADKAPGEFSQRFLLSEWTNIVDAWQIDSGDAYGTAPRLGRKSRLGAKQRARLWPIFEFVQSDIAARNLLTEAQLFAAVARHFGVLERKPFDNIVVDEAQDLGVPELRWLAAIAPTTPDVLFFAGDLGQRIFRQPFSWKSLGVDVCGRSSVLKVNYRTSHQIRQAADSLVPESIRDIDGMEEDRKGTVSAFNGPSPIVKTFTSTEEETESVAAFVRETIAEGFAPSDIAIFVRGRDELPRARAIVKAAGQIALELSDRAEKLGGRVAIGTMHLAKGLEFKAVAVVACDEEIVPLQARIEAVADEAELDDVFETERQLLYVACTRARDKLWVSGLAPGSEFLADLKQDRRQSSV